MDAANPDADATPGPADTSDRVDPADARRLRAAEQQARAEQTLARIFAGGDLGAETLALSNRFTDDAAERLTRRWRRRPATETSTGPGVEPATEPGAD
ncbi:hypothetical protein [Schumannella sp. 10F1B-5-1]|uniref:hypothetical protein n=1 Tax=Schumannella sp. 10F1B-5-1 TaxID=2590780 RepID=UPI0011308876|nr:hypothetical protein [Schumannella sp. 10F1B-5-1]TPW73186.1 hypothetical protein FJ658_08095 [Schumannella sp. 10F1B-5-1]